MTPLKKSIAVLAVSLPLAASAQQAAPAAAPAPLYQVYGTLNVNAQYVEISKRPTAAGQSVSGRFGVSVDSTNIGIKGTADTGQFGIGVVYQCETSANVDGVTAAITSLPNGLQAVCNRNSRLGLTHTFGTLFYGNWDTPFKAIWYGTKGDDAFSNTDIYDAAGIMGSPGFKTRSSAGATTLGVTVAGGVTSVQTDRTFNVRAANSIAYHSPKVAGAQLKAQWSTNENGSLNNRISPQLWSAGVNFDQGPISVFAAWERHDDWTGLANIAGTAAPLGAAAGTASTVDEGWRVGAGYELGTPFGTTTVGGVWEWLEYRFAHPGSAGAGTPSVPATAVKRYARQAAMVNLKHRMGNHELRLRYEWADNGECSLMGGARCNFDAGLGAQNYAVGYAYYLSKAAQLYAFWTMIENQRNASYTFATAGPAALTGGWAAGADPAGVGLGIRYAF